ncbi:hypothetical protein GCM10010294_65230 [Streptomyces griseoloalbus]|uniref:hypothetical protein n=1 Tax=Streptomyces griseoloalbus TaxID=67303 RepID=UPI00187730B4|nr:hypothetical protein GCM10010294_65230 [Streptomyces griseoloalbus]
MSDAIRRPGDMPPPEGTRTTPGTDPHADDPHGTDLHDTGRAAVGTPAAHPPAAAHPPTGDTPGGDTAHPGPRRADRAPGTGTGTGTHHDGEGEAGHRLLRHDDSDKLAAQLQHAVAGFVDAPRDAVQQADQVLQELTQRFTDAVTERRRTLRRSWHTADADEGRSVTAADTEQLRLALRDYRELAERLLRA